MNYANWPRKRGDQMELTSDEIATWFKVMTMFRPIYADVRTRNSALGVKNDVQVFFKMFNDQPQVSVLYGQKWYPFNLLPLRTAEEKFNQLKMNLIFKDLKNSADIIEKAMEMTVPQ